MANHSHAQNMRSLFTLSFHGKPLPSFLLCFSNFYLSFKSQLNYHFHTAAGSPPLTTLASPMYLHLLLHLILPLFIPEFHISVPVSVGRLEEGGLLYSDRLPRLAWRSSPPKEVLIVLFGVLSSLCTNSGMI
jgi:hypothetical protein